MKLLTINTHSLIEDNYEYKLDVFTEAIARLRPDVIAMQEVNQTASAPVVGLGDGFYIRSDNHAYAVCRRLYDKGINYSCIWRGIKRSYDIFEEGVAILSRKPISETDTFVMSNTQDIKNWHSRRALGVKIADKWFYSVHMGRFDDAEDSFSGQWQRFLICTEIKQNVWVMGDFNCNAHGEGYDTVINSGWHDSYYAADEHDDGITVKGNIDGWRDCKNGDMRIDYIFSNSKQNVKSSHVIFNGKNENIVSDHFGIMVEV